MLFSPRLRPLLRHFTGFFSPESRSPQLFVAYAQSKEDGRVQVLGVFVDPLDAKACADNAVAMTDEFLAKEVHVVESPLFLLAKEYHPGLFLD